MPEKILSQQSFAPFPNHTFRSKKAAVRELLSPCSGFKTPFTIKEKMSALVSEEFAHHIDVLDSVTHIVAPGTPLNWHILLRYLHKKGVLRAPHFYFLPRRNDLPQTLNIWVAAKWNARETDGVEVVLDGHSNGFTVETALSKAVGETLERYYLAMYQRSDFFCSTYKELVGRSRSPLDISTLNQFSPMQQKRNPRFAFDGDSPIYWTEAKKVDGTKVYIPAQLAFWNYNSSVDTKEPILGPITTSGGAGHFTRNGAILSGLLELIERDGFLIYWMNSLSPKKIDVSKIDDVELQSLLSKISRYGLEIHFLDTTTDVDIPSVICAIIDRRTDNPILSLGGGTGFNLYDTIIHSGHEALSILHYAAEKQKFPLDPGREPYTEARIGRMERLAVWQGEDMMHHFSFFISGETETFETFMKNHTEPKDTDEALARVTSHLSALGEGYDQYVFDVKSDVLDAIGYHVVKTVVPQLIPLHLHENVAMLDSKRLREVPKKIGYSAPSTLNPYPHPLP